MTKIITFVLRMFIPQSIFQILCNMFRHYFIFIYALDYFYFLLVYLVKLLGIIRNTLLDLFFLMAFGIFV